MKTRTLVIILILVLAVLIIIGGCATTGKMTESTTGIADEFDWPRWRGPNGDGKSMESGWDPEALEGEPKIVWNKDVGQGYSNIVIKGKYLYTMGNEDEEDIIYCLNSETGKEVWRYSYHHHYLWSYGGATQSTPIIEGMYVYALSIEGILLCLEAKNGKLRWKKDLVSEYDVVKPYFDFGGSPVIEGDLIILTANTSGIALDKKTGEMVWGSDKPPEGLYLYPSTGPHYATPVLYDYEGKRYAVITSYLGIHSVDVETGKVLWLYKWEPFRDIHASDPLIFDNKVFIAQYSRGGSVLLDIKRGEPKVLWENKNMSSDTSSPVLINGYIYGCEGGPYQNQGLLRCLDVETGEVMWEEDLDTKSITLMAADGRLIILREDGTLRIAKAKPSSYKEISSGNVPVGEGQSRKFWTPPVLCNGKIYCRNYDGDLVCIDVSK
jgi:outer membrane protein assembly factor BamB